MQEGKLSTATAETRTGQAAKRGGVLGWVMCGASMYCPSDGVIAGGVTRLEPSGKVVYRSGLVAIRWMDGQCVRLLLAYRDDNNLRHLFCWMTRMPCVHVGGCASSGGCSLPPAGSARAAARTGPAERRPEDAQHQHERGRQARPCKRKGKQRDAFLFFSLFSMLEGKNENPRTQPRGDIPDGLPSPFAL